MTLGAKSDPVLLLELVHRLQQLADLVLHCRGRNSAGQGSLDRESWMKRTRARTYKEPDLTPTLTAQRYGLVPHDEPDAYP